MNRVVGLRELADAEPVEQGEGLATIAVSSQEAPWELPEGWAWARLDTLCSFIGRGRGPTYVSEGGVPVVNQKCVRWRRLERKHLKLTAKPAFERLSPELRLRRGDVLWNSTGTGTIGRAVVFDGSTDEITADSHVTIVRPANVESAYLGYFIETARVQHLVTDGHFGSTNQQELPRSFVQALRIPLPPLAEQRRIVARIDALFAEIANGEAALKAARDGLDTFRRTLLKAAVTGALTADWRETNHPAETGQDVLARLRAEQGARCQTRGRGRTGSATTFDASLLPSVPDGWSWTPLGDLLVGIEAGLNVAAEGRPPRIGEVGIVKVSAVTWGEFDEFESKALKPGTPYDPDDVIRPGDFLFSRANTLELVGAPVIVKAISRTLVLSDKVLRFKFIDSLNFWIELFLKSVFGRQQIEALATGNQLSMRNIAQDAIRAIRIPIPPPAETAEILRRVSDALGALDDTRAMLDAEVADAARLRQSVLKAAFAGRLMPQDPTDEPASALLARLGNPKPIPRAGRRPRARLR